MGKSMRNTDPLRIKMVNEALNSVQVRLMRLIEENTPYSHRYFQRLHDPISNQLLVPTMEIINNMESLGYDKLI